MNPNKAFKNAHATPEQGTVLTDDGSGVIDVRNYSRLKFMCTHCDSVRFLDVRGIRILVAHVTYECPGCGEIDWTVSVEALKS